MSNTVLIKRSAVQSKNPITTDLSLGELALNTYDGNLFFKKSPGGVESIVSVVTLDGTQTLTNKTLTSPIINGISYPSTDGTNGQAITTNGSGQLQFTTISGSGSGVGGYDNSSLTAFPSGDYQGTDAYVGASSSSITDAFGVSLFTTFTCMDPVGSLQTTDLGVLT